MKLTKKQLLKKLEDSREDLTIALNSLEYLIPDRKENTDYEVNETLFSLYRWIHSAWNKLLIVENNIKEREK